MVNHLNSDNNPLGKYELELIKGLRQEAYAVKDCFTRYSIQGIGLFVLALAIIVRVQFNAGMMFFIALAIITLLSALARMGTHKYATSSRLSGYELHLQRMSRLSIVSEYEWKPDWSKVGWEEAMKAWRIVQATVFQALYISESENKPVKEKYPPKWKIGLLVPEIIYKRWKQDTPSQRYFEYKNQIERSREGSRENHDEEEHKEKYFWFEPNSMISEEGAEYYPGGYLRTMIRVINMALLISFIFLAISTYMCYEQSSLAHSVAGQESINEFNLNQSAVPSTSLIQNTIIRWIIYTTFVVFTFLLAIQYRVLKKRLYIIEHGLLSIHSSAILWQAIIVAHHRAIDQINSNLSGVLNYKGYTRELAKQANSLAKNIFDVHEWMKPKMGRIGQNLEYSSE